MKYLKIYEEFNDGDVVKYRGQPAKVVSEESDKVTINLLKFNRKLEVGKNEITKINKCLSQCDKKVITDEEGKRFVKCSFCGMEKRFKR